MSPSKAPDTKPVRGALFLSLVYCAALSGLACSDPSPVTIARFPAVSGASAGSIEVGGSGGTASGGVGGVDVGSGEAGAAGSLPSSIPAQRGRVKVVDGKLVTDLGTPLRGLLLPVDKNWALTDFDFLHTLAQSSGLNALHVYLEDAGQVTGSMETQADLLVSLTAQNGMYLILGVGTGSAVGSFDAAKIKEFWTLYAPRYASSTHVLFEIQNNPETTCKKNVLAATLDMERQTYQQIRGLAPDSHILLFSTTSLVQASVFTDAVDRLGSTVDWTNASFAIDMTADCLPNSLSALTAAAKKDGVPLLIAQLPPTTWQTEIPTYERAGIGWFQYRWFVTKRDLQSYFTEMTAAAVTWCPERGTFPQDSSTCR